MASDRTTTVSSTPVAEELDKTLRRATTLATFVDKLIRLERSTPSLDLLYELCGVNGALLYFKKLIQSEALLEQWATTLTILCSPSESLQQFLSMLEMLISTITPTRDEREHRLALSKSNKVVMSIKRRCEKQKMVILSALQNKPEFLCKAMEEMSNDEQGGEVWSGQLVEGDRIPLDGLGTVTLPIPGTGQWLLQSKEFEGWKANPRSVAWLCGLPGSGKTTLCASVVEHMRSNKTPPDALAYFFFGTRQGVAENCMSCLRSLVAQLQYATRNSRCPCRDHTAERSVLLKELHLLILSQPRTFIILDGIDEAQDKEEVLELLSILANEELENLHLFISSRPETRNTETLDPMMVATLSIEGQVINEDIAVYVEHYFYISSTTKTCDTSVKREMKDWLVHEAEGRFLWITFCLVLLERCPELKTNIQTLPKSMPRVFDYLLSSIPEGKEKQAHQALQWLAFAERPVRLEELTEAINISSKAEGSPYTRLPTSYAISDICSGLITSVSTLEFVFFAHRSLRDYLMAGVIVSQRAANFKLQAINAQLMISYASLNCLLSDVPFSAEGPIGSPLQNYVTKYWYRHVQAVTADMTMPEDLGNLAIKLLDERYKIGKRRLTDISLFKERGLSPGIKHFSVAIDGEETCGEPWFFPPPLYYASCLGWIELVRMLISRGDRDLDTDWPSNFFGTPLHVASYRGHHHISKMLLNAGASAKSASDYYGNPVQAAACGGHAKLIELLSMFGADIDAKGGVYGNALVAAAKGGHKTAVDMLTEHGAELNAEGNEDYPTALYAASLNGHQEVVARLLHWGADPNREYTHGKSALRAAIKGGHEDIVVLLIEYGASLDQKCHSGPNDGELALHMAVKHGYVDLMRSLLTWPCVNADSPNEEGLSPLLIAVSHSQAEMVRALLDNRWKTIDLRAKDRSGSTALMIAAKFGYLDVVRVILEHYDRTQETGPQASNSFMMAVSGGNQGLVALLLEFGATPGRSNRYDQIPLTVAIELGYTAITFLLLQYGAKIDDTDGSGNKPIDVAVSKGYRTIEKLLKFGEGNKAIADRDSWWKTVSRVKDDDWVKVTKQDGR